MTIYGGPDIVTNGLVLHLDAGNSKSYPGSGTVWTDLSGNGNNGTLTNGPIYNSGNKGNIVLDNIDDSINTSTISRIGSNNTTQLVWYKWSGTNQNRLLSYIGNNAGANGLGLYVGTQGCVASNKIGIFLGGQTCNRSDQLGTAQILDTNWKMFVLSRDTTANNFYINTSLVSSSTNTPTGNTTTFNQFFVAVGGSVGIVMLYYKTLSLSEITINFNALKGRYGL